MTTTLIPTGITATTDHPLLTEHMARGLLACGYICTPMPATWEDDGDAENGPHLSGGPEYDEWRNGDKYLIVVDGFVVETGVDQPVPANFPF